MSEPTRDDYLARAADALATVQAHLFDAWDHPDSEGEEYGGPLDTVIEHSHTLARSIDQLLRPFNHPITVGGDA